MNIKRGKKILCIKSEIEIGIIEGNYYEIINFTTDFSIISINCNGYIRKFFKNQTNIIRGYRLFYDYFITKSIGEIRKDKIDLLLGL